MRFLIRAIQAASLLVVCFLISGCPFFGLSNNHQSDVFAIDDNPQKSKQGDMRESLRHLGKYNISAAEAQSFWSQHDPTPNTDENEFQDYYNQLVDIANENFREKLLPGALTDRGRVLILYGPPDEVVEEPLYMGYMTDNVYRSEDYWSGIKSMIVWYYDSPDYDNYTYEFTGRMYSGIYFEFGDLEGYGAYSLIGTNVDEEIVDLRAWQ